MDKTAYLKIIAKQDELIDSFTEWVRLVKANDLEKAADVVKLSNKLRIEITELKKALKSKIITKFN
jgi:hypothetical protein